MDRCAPIYTEKTECQDCYKCVRSCPVKAIKIEAGVASVVDARCIACGTCVQVCPAGAKRTRNDTRIVKSALQRGEKVMVSLAPSFRSEFSEWETAALVPAIRRLGFSGVSETALGAQEVSAHVAEMMNRDKDANFISSACPAVVEYISRYRPALLASLTTIVSPLAAHCRLLRKAYGEACRIVFFGPCIAKKREADNGEAGLIAALTFDDLRRWFAEAGINPTTVTAEADAGFVPCAAQAGILYPVEGGMLAGIKANCPTRDVRCMSFSGAETVIRVLDDLEKTPEHRGLVLELLACPGGCVNGPVTRDRSSALAKRSCILKALAAGQDQGPRSPSINLSMVFKADALTRKAYTEEQVREVLRQTGKIRTDDEFNCGGCGYNSCRELAVAVLEGNAETVMCVTYMRQLAQKKANKLIMTIPSALVIVDKDLRIVECNRNFARMAGSDAEEIFNIHQGLQGAVLDKVLPLSALFRHVLDTGEEIIEKDMTLDHRVLNCSLFVIEAGSSVGCILNDITEPSLKKDEIVKRTRQVIRKNLKTVQKIAYLLGENAAETELSLNAIIGSYDREGDETGGDR